MTTTESHGQKTGGKPISLHQLQVEVQAAGVQVDALGQQGEDLYPYDAEGLPCDFAAADQPTVDTCITNHVAMRDKTDAEYAAEFQDPATTAARKQQIRDQQSGLEPREQVPITQEEWDQRQGLMAV